MRTSVQGLGVSLTFAALRRAGGAPGCGGGWGGWGAQGPWEDEDAANVALCCRGCEWVPGETQGSAPSRPGWRDAGSHEPWGTVGTPTAANLQG